MKIHTFLFVLATGILLVCPSCVTAPAIMDGAAEKGFYWASDWSQGEPPPYECCLANNFDSNECPRREQAEFCRFASSSVYSRIREMGNNWRDKDFLASHSREFHSAYLLSDRACSFNDEYCTYLTTGLEFDVLLPSAEFVRQRDRLAQLCLEGRGAKPVHMGNFCRELITFFEDHEPIDRARAHKLAEMACKMGNSNTCEEIGADDATIAASKETKQGFIRENDERATERAAERQAEADREASAPKWGDTAVSAIGQSGQNDPIQREINRQVRNIGQSQPPQPVYSPSSVANASPQPGKKKTFELENVSGQGSTVFPVPAASPSPAPGNKDTTYSGADTSSPNPPKVVSMPTGRNDTHSYHEGGKFDGCVRYFYDPTMYNWYSVENNCGEDITVSFVNPMGTVDIRPRTAGCTGYSKSEMENKYPNMSFAVCKGGYLPINAEGREWAGGLYRCKSR